MIKLSEPQRRILSVLSELGEQPIPILAKAAGLRHHSARYALNQLIRRKIVSPFTYVNVRTLGYGAYSIFFSLVGSDEKQRARFLSKLQESERVSWIAEFAGDYQYAITMIARRVDEFEVFLEEFSSVPGVQFSDKAIRLEFSFHYFPLKYFLKPGRACAEVSWTRSEHPEISLDHIDHKLLVELSDGDHPPLATFARKLGVPSTTAHSRIEKLKSKRVIETLTYFFNADRAGLHTYKCLIFARGMDPRFKKALLEFGKRHPNVSLIVTCAGAWDFEVNFTLDDGSKLNGCIHELYTRFGPHISNVKALQLLHHRKVEMYPLRSAPSV